MEGAGMSSSGATALSRLRARPCGAGGDRAGLQADGRTPSVPIARHQIGDAIAALCQGSSWDSRFLAAALRWQQGQSRGDSAGSSAAHCSPG